MIDYLGKHAVTGPVAGKYRLGFVADPLSGDERFRGSLAIPYLSPKGVTAIRYRLFGQDAKIGQHKGQTPRLFNTEVLFSAGTTLGIAEGEIDAIVATELLGVPTIGVPGATTWKDYWTPILKDYTTVYIFADGDKPGRDFASEVAERASWRGRIIYCPDGEDVSSMAFAGKLDDLRTKMSTSNDDEV